MPGLTLSPPVTTIEPVTEVLHGIPITDPYRWLEEQDSPRTRQWIEEQGRFARAYLDHLPGRDRIRERIREFLAVETYDSLQKAGTRYFFRKRLANQEQPCIYMRVGADAEDHLVVDPAEHGAGKYTAVKPLRVSPDGRLLLFEVKEGGERTGTFKLFDIENKRTLPDVLPRGYLRGFAFAPDGKGFCYVHEPANGQEPYRRSAFRHVLGTEFSEDREIFFAGGGEKVRLCLTSDSTRIGFLVYRFLEKTRTDFFVQPWESEGTPETILRDADYSFGPMLLRGRILAITNRHAPNLRIVELRFRPGAEPEWRDLIPDSDSRILQWAVADNRILTLASKGMDRYIRVYDLAGRKTEEVTVNPDETFRIAGAGPESDEVFLERESFTDPIRIVRYSPERKECALWAKRTVPRGPSDVSYTQLSYPSKDGTRIPMYLVGRRELLAGGCHPAIMTSYGGYGVSMTPQFSAFVAFLIERGCLFALPNIRGGSEFGVAWHEAAKRRKRQTAYDDFLSAAEWLIKMGRTTAAKLAIFGGSNSGLLVGAAITQRPELFRAAVCMVPMLDMLRYHLFDNADVWSEEFGTAEDHDDFEALRRYSPYHQVRDGIAYPATMIVSGDADRNCNPLHARKMTARLQAANASPYPVFLDYSPFRGHSPVLPLSERIEALTDRMAFLCDQLQLSA
ncbi:MAG TPA: prolyl oligopeptidase family serine peptidase [Candidatus Acidoferrum sp.]|nr:prolyl oligopeptidase family serine peptidase [Candidatus Acidoferrum sp.]